MLQFITHTTPAYDTLASAEIALEGGCRWIQLRMKEATEEERLLTAFALRRLCNEYKATFIVDDFVDLALACAADGVHLGKNDMPVSEARKIVGNKLIIGGTANTFDDVKALAAAGADYIGLGPFRFTQTKKNLSPILGLEGYSVICKAMREAHLSLPVVAIGGITASDIPDLLQTGITGIALSGTILQAENPIEETRRICQLIAERNKTK